VPADWTPEQAKAFAIADNRTAELASWNQEKLALQLGELQEAGYELEDLGFTELPDPNFDDKPADKADDENAYTNVVNIPQYEIVGEQPGLDELMDTTRADLLRAEINKSNAPLEVKSFLLAAANRHTVFNYRKIAEYYPHASAEIQKLMEDSALVIIDFKDAIRMGYATLSSKIEELRKADQNAAQ